MRRARAALGAGAVLAAGALLAAGPEPPPSFERGIDVPRPGKVVLMLDREIYERARSDLGDLRVVDETGADAPYLLERVGSDPEPRFRVPVALNRGFVRGRSTSLTLDLREPVLKSELVLALPGDNFRRRVKVEGRNKHERQWTTITDSAYVFAVPEPVAARYETVQLPQNNQQLLRITVFNGPDDPPRLEILDVWVRPQERRKPREYPLEPRVTRADDAAERESRLVLNLGARYQPFRAVLLDVGDAEFFRGAAVEERREPALDARGESALPISWAPVLERASLYRYQEEGETRECLRLEAAGRARVLRVRIRNRDDRPLSVRGVSVMVPQERLVFEAVSPHRYRLSYGDQSREPPVYDVERTVGDPALWIAQASPGRWQAPVVRGREGGPKLPWTERYPALLWAGLVAAVGLLAGVTWRALQSAP